jgi:hypothetical protein
MFLALAFDKPEDVHEHQDASVNKQGTHMEHTLKLEDGVLVLEKDDDDDMHVQGGIEGDTDKRSMRLLDERKDGYTLGIGDEVGRS